MRAVVVSYLQAKRVWTPTGSYAGPPKRSERDPDAMDIGKVGDKGNKGKDANKGGPGKGKGGKNMKKTQRETRRKGQGQEKGKG